MTSEDKARKSDPREAPKERSRGQEIVEHLRQAGGDKYRMTTEEIMRLTRGEDWGTGLEDEEVDPLYLRNFKRLLNEIDRSG